ncbi:ArsR/SmtB family transcription factor [Pacificoceanicola onchidii]|uniref:ArsR/SmtB family transcription factor n=1 Tax=Pacificoceanicola onchidii TaxID=2562685 RepID=UPI0010A31F97|nr:helix-turn-helix domain-containing protein [Pacificoceanicola onchidii]
MKMNDLNPTTLTPEQAAAKFAALGSEQRLLVLQTLVRAGPDGLSMGALGERCGITGSTLTHHLKILAAAELVSQARSGRSIICAGAAYAEVEALSEYLLKECCADVTCADDSASEKEPENG